MSPDIWLKIEAVFQEAADLPPHERAEFLDRKCGSDAALRLEVEKLLEHDAAAGDFIESPVWSESALFTTSSKKELSVSVDRELSRNGDDELLGKQIGVWRLTRELGRGGMGAVYLAERSDGEFRQRAAIKLIKRGMDSDFIIRRFRHERQILASFEHPFIARLLDGGSTSDGVPYFVMEYIEGDTLFNYCDAKSLSIRDRLKLFQKVCAAIHYAHERQIIHRDIKPGNILISASGTPKLLDFGIAKILDTDLIHESLNPTASMLRMMTPDYASPEQVRGVEVTPASDIYSLGVLLYELLTGHRPYNFEGRSLHEVSRVICEVPAILPSKVIFESANLLKRYSDKKSRFLDTRRTDQKQLAQELERNIDDLVMKAIAKEPADRYVSAKDLSEDISRHLKGNRVTAPPFVSASRPQPEAAAKSAKSPSKALAVLPFKYLNLGPVSDTDDRFLGLGLADALIARLSKIRRFTVRPTGSILSFSEEHTDPVKAGETLNVDFILDGNIKRAGDRLRVSVQLLNVKSNAAIWATSIDETVADVLTLETILANKVIDVLLPQLTGNELAEFAKRGTDDPEAFEHYLRGRYHFNKSTEEGFAQAFVEFHAAIASDPKYALAYCGIADYYNWLGIIGVLAPQECFEPAIQAASKALELDPASSDAHASLAFSLHAGKYDWARSERHFLNAIELNPNNANAYVWYSIVLYTVGRFDEGLKYAQQSIEIDPLTPFNHHNLGWGLYFARRFDEAAAQYEKVTIDFPLYNFGHYGLSKVYRILGRTKEAITENDKALELTGGSVFAMLSDAECYAADGQDSVARAKLANLEELSKSRFVSPYQISLGYCFLNDRDAALRSLEKAAETQEAWLNWMGVEPVLDLVRDEPRFQAIFSDIGYASIFADPFAETRATGLVADHLHELTTMRIEGGDVTEDATRPLAKRKWTAWALAAALLAMMIVGGFFAIPALFRTGTQTRPLSAYQNRSIVILPFRTESTSDEAIGIGMADALTSKLGNIKALQLISASAGRSVAGEDPEQIRNSVGAAYVFSGNLAADREQMQLTGKLVSTADGEVLWSDTVAAPKGDLFSLQAAVAERIWTALGVEPVALELNEVRKPYTSSNEAYQEYLVGRTQMTDRSRENLRRSIATFSLAVSADPDFGLAYVGLADAHALLNLYDIEPPPDAYPTAIRYAEKALQLDDGLAEAHASLAYVKFYYERDRQGAELEFRRAIQLNPSYAQARHWFALALTAMGKPADALSEAEAAQQLDPLSPSIKSATGIVYFMDGRYAEALAQCDDALTIDPTFVPAHKVKRWIYFAMRDLDNARASFDKELAYSNGSRDDAGWKIIDLQMRAQLGQTTSKEIATVAAAKEIISNPFFFAFEVALAFNAVGDTQRALDWIERAEASGNHSFNFLAVDPRVSNLHSEPRFQRLLTKLR